MGTLHLGELVRRAARIAPRSEAIWTASAQESWDATAAGVEQLAGRLVAAGIATGDRVAILADNSGGFVRAFLAIARAGAIAAPINTRLMAAEMAAQLRDADAALLLADARHGAVALRLSAQAAVAAVAGLDDAEGLPSLPQSIGELAMPTDDDAVVCLLYTGGTTGRPKGVMHCSRSLVMNAFQSGAILGTVDAIRFVHVAPMFHIGAIAYVVAVTLHAGTHVPLPHFDPAAVLETIAAARATHVTLVPTMMARVLDCPAIGTADIGSLRRVIYGASPISETLLRRAIQAWPDVAFAQSYGQTESVTITMLPAERHVLDGPLAGKLRTAGVAAPGVDVRIDDGAGGSAPCGMLGEIMLRSQSLMAGYWRQPDATLAAMAGDWLKTGDIGCMDADGFLSVVDRMKDIIISGGENIYSVEVEDALARHPAVGQCAVIAAADPVWGEVVHAVIGLRDGATLDAEALKAHARDHLAGFKVPRRVTFLSAPFPLSGAGKILKRELRLMLSDGRDG